MRVAVVIPTWNESANVALAIASAWTAGADEVIVVDGSSHDDTVEQAARAASKVLVTCAGRGHQQNQGAAATAADWLLFLHADNRLGPASIQQLRTSAAEAGAGCGAFRQRIEAKGFMYRLVEQGNAARVRWWGLPYGDQAIFVRRDLFLEAGGFPETRLLEDYVLMRRLRRYSWPRLLDGPVYVSARRWQQHGILRQTLRNWCLLGAYHWGVSPERLAAYYYPQRGVPQLAGTPPRHAPGEKEQ